MAGFWSDIGADIRFRHRLRYPAGSGPWGWLRASLLSRGTLVLAAHRLTRTAKVYRTERRVWAWPVGCAAALGRQAALVMAKTHITSSSAIAPGVCLPDEGHLIIGPLEIGAGTVIHTRVTIGMGVVHGGRPRIGANVWIGTDCVVYGDITVGDGATVLPGTVVTRHIPPGAVVSGNPPRLVAFRFGDSPWRASPARDHRGATDLRARCPRGVRPP